MRSNGTLVLVVGPSGAGKDALLEAARRTFSDDRRLHFATRVVTRPAGSGGERHEAMTVEAFARAQEAGAFALTWQANGLAYGVRHHELAPLDRGAVVVLNTSRTLVPDAQRFAARVLVMHVTAPIAVLAERIARRGRETAAEAKARLERQPIPAVDGVEVVTIDNGGSLAEGEAAFVIALRRVLAAVSARDR